MIIIALVSLVESTGVFFAIGDLLHQDITEEDLKKGYRAEGLAQIFGGLFNTFPYTTFSQNVGLLQLSGIKTKRPIYWAAGLLMAMGLLPKIGALVTIIPDSVLGGAMLVMFTMIAVQGIKMLTKVDLKIIAHFNCRNFYRYGLRRNCLSSNLPNSPPNHSIVLRQRYRSCQHLCNSA